jgi:hypothetical protein
MESELSYLVRRVAQERAAASAAGDAKVRDAHERLAAHYQAQIRSAQDGETASEATSEASG